MTGVCGQKRVPIDYFSNSVIALPPIVEQKVITDQVDKFMLIIDKLEKQITERKNQSEMLMQSILREAFKNE